MAVIDQKNETFSGNKTFTRIESNKKNHTITGANDDNKLTFDSLSKTFSADPDNIDILVDLKGGSDTVDFKGSIDNSVHITANSDRDDYEFMSTGGNGSQNMKSFEVWYRNVETFDLTIRHDSINMVGSTGDYNAYGDAGFDALTGNTGKNVLDGGSDNDRINGGGGADTIIGGNDNDNLTGGTGADQFIFDSSDGTDLITDLETADTLYFEGADMADVQVSRDSGDGVFTFGDTTIIVEGLGKIQGKDFTFSEDTSGLTMSWNGTESFGSNDTVICTYMFNRGYIPADVYKWDGIYGQRLGAEVLAGYHAWAIPLVERVLKRSEVATQLVRPLACAWAQEMAHRCDPENHPKGSVLGRSILTVGVPLCRTIAQLGFAASSRASA